MRKIIFTTCQFVLAILFALNVNAHETFNIATGKSDAEIQQCISERFAASSSLKDQGFTAVVNNSVATLAGTAKNPGSKGTATRIAKKCGATSVTNNITISSSYKPMKKSAGERKM